MDSARRLVAEAIDAVRVHSSTRYSWFGRMSPRLPARITSALTPRTARDYLAHTLAGQLYADFYLRGRAEPAQWPVRSSPTTRRAFENLLSDANRGHGYRDGGWWLRDLDDDRAVIVKGGLELTVGRSELMDTEGGVLSVGSQVTLRMPRELFRIAPGFYTAYGDEPLEASRAEPLLRLYWNLTATGAAAFVTEATGRLNAVGVPFRLKVVNDPGAFSRCDAGVVYLHDGGPWRPLALSIHERLVGHVRDRVPVFTRRLAPGLAVAHDPGSDESFGQHRCRLLAQGLLLANDHGVTDGAGAMAVVEQRFAADGVDLDTPYVSSQGGLGDAVTR